MAESGGLIDLLACPLCGSSLGAGVRDNAAAACPRGHKFERSRGYIDFSCTVQADTTTGRTLDSFGYEWNTFDDLREEDEEFAQVYFKDLDMSSLEGKAGLDAGCGKGRYTRFVAPHLKWMLALDGSSAVEAAARNLRPHRNVLVVKADLRQAPIPPSSLDFVMSLGVLHHLEDPRRGFEKLAALLAPGGRMLLYLYSRPSAAGFRRTGLYLSCQLRKFTLHLPHDVLKVFSVPVAVTLYLGVVEAGALGDRMGIGALSRLPMSSYRGKPFRTLVLDTFDRLSAPVEHRYLWEELAEWFEDAGLEVDACREEAGWFIICHKPGGSIGASPNRSRKRLAVGN